MHVGQKVYFIYLCETVEIVAIQEYLDSLVKDLVVEDQDGRLWEATSYEVSTCEAL